MFNGRTFLLGLGAGIIIGALLLQLFYLGQNSQENLKNIGDQLENGELEQGSGGAKSGLQDQVDASPEPVPEPGNQNDQLEPSPEPKPEPDAGSDAENSDNAAEPSAETGEAALGALRLIRIEPGMRLEEIADILTDNRIIDSNESQSFIANMEAGAKLARAGYYAMPEDFGVESVVTAVTSQPLSKEEAERRVSKQPE